MGLYLDNGFINTAWIADQADKNNLSFIVIIGSRQIGKTWGCLDFVLREGKPFILMRRTMSEVEFIAIGANHPFSGHGKEITVKKDSKYTAAVFEELPESDPEQIGSVMALSTVSKIRGFNGQSYEDLIFDEFIPEAHVTQIKHEGDAFANAIVTISGNRELEGRKPLRCWLLANSNNIDSPILKALNIQKKVEDMKNRCQEYAVMPDRGIMIILPMSGQIKDKRKNTALFRAIGAESKFTEMALDNKFSYNDESDVCRVNMSEYKPLAKVADVYLYRHKSKRLVFVSAHRSGTFNAAYQDTDKDKARFKREMGYMRGLYTAGGVNFESLTVKSTVLDFIY